MIQLAAFFPLPQSFAVSSKISARFLDSVIVHASSSEMPYCRGYLAARMLGADGVVMGTRFLLSEECGIHPRFRERLLHTDETGTKVIQYSIRNPIRALHNRAADQVAEMERQHAGLEQLLTVTNGQNGRRCWMEGDTENGIQAVGQCVGLIHDVKPAGEIIREIMSGAEELAASFRLP